MATYTPQISSGKVTALWRILRVVRKYKNIPENDLLQIAKNTSLRGGGLPIDQGMKLASIGRFVTVENKKVDITALGQKIVSIYDNEEPNPKAIRELLLPLIIETMPIWVTFIAKPLEERIIAIPEQWRQMLRNAELLDNPLSEDANKWWIRLQHSIEESDNRLRKTIGDAGENLTIKYEKERLLKDRHPNLAEKVEWVSKISDKFGFDVASFLGYLTLNSGKPNDDIMIEVKSTTSISKKNFRFYLSRNEWEVANKNNQNYYFYLWGSIKVDGENIEGEGPIILPVHSIRQYVPSDNQDSGMWTECRINYNLLDIQ